MRDEGIMLHQKTSLQVANKIVKHNTLVGERVVVKDTLSLLFHQTSNYIKQNIKQT